MFKIFGDPGRTCTPDQAFMSPRKVFSHLI